MRIACSFLFSLMLAAGALAQSRLTVDRLDRKDIATAAKEASFSTLLEGTVDDQNLLVYVLVYEPGLNVWRSYRASVNREPNATGRYSWAAICHFGEFDGRGVGASYQVRTVAVDPQLLGRAKISSSLPPGALQANPLTIKRVKK